MTNMKYCQNMSFSRIYLFLFFFGNVFPSSLESETFNELGLPVIIWWTDMLFPHVGREFKIQCSLGSCISCTKRNYKNDHVNITYMFYGTDFDPENLPLPRKDNHLWTLFHEESPMNNYMLSHIPGITLFNFTSTFSRYSDHPVTTQFIPSLDYFTERKPISLNQKNKLRKDGFAPVLYLQSHCNVASDRDSYIQELMNFIDIDSYGTCLHNKDLPSHLSSTETYNDASLFSFIAQYKFHIAFENALCDDYITEKLYRALHVGSVPIYKGSPSVKDWAPDSNSVIIADDFSSPSELADFISLLDKNDSLYNTYLEFKENGVTNPHLRHEISNRVWGVNDINKIDFIQSFECYVCDKMFDLGDKHHIANKKHMNCHQPHPSVSQKKVDKMGECGGMEQYVFLVTNHSKHFTHHTLDEAVVAHSSNGKSRWWLREDWIENYWFAYDKAKAVQMMLQNKDKDTSRFMKYIEHQKY